VATLDGSYSYVKYVTLNILAVCYTKREALSVRGAA
jgi:hypothetical protein